jgi:non-ribosomal peptide synthetase component F
VSRTQLPPEQLHAMAQAFGDETAYQVLGGGSLTFDEWDTEASRLARGLVAAGVGPGEPVAIHLEPANALPCRMRPSTAPERWPSRSTPSWPAPKWST